MPLYYIVEMHDQFPLLHAEKIKAVDYHHAWQIAQEVYPDVNVDVIDAQALDTVSKDKNLILYLLSLTIWMNESLPELVQRYYNGRTTSIESDSSVTHHE